MNIFLYLRPEGVCVFLKKLERTVKSENCNNMRILNCYGGENTKSETI